MRLIIGRVSACVETEGIMEISIPSSQFCFHPRTSLKKVLRSLADIAQWIEHGPVNQRVAGWIPSQGTCLGCGPGPQ